MKMKEAVLSYIKKIHTSSCQKPYLSSKYPNSSLQKHYILFLLTVTLISQILHRIALSSLFLNVSNFFLLLQLWMRKISLAFRKCDCFDYYGLILNPSLYVLRHFLHRGRTTKMLSISEHHVMYSIKYEQKWLVLYVELYSALWKTTCK